MASGQIAGLVEAPDQVLQDWAGGPGQAVAGDDGGTEREQSRADVVSALHLVLGRHPEGLELGQEPAEDALVDSGASGGVADSKAIRGCCQCLQHMDQAPRGAGGDERLPFRPVGRGAMWSGDQRTHCALTRAAWRV